VYAEPYGQEVVDDPCAVFLVGQGAADQEEPKDSPLGPDGDHQSRVHSNAVRPNGPAPASAIVNGASAPVAIRIRTGSRFIAVVWIRLSVRDKRR
jgi:hypothetical protein